MAKYIPRSAMRSRDRRYRKIFKRMGYLRRDQRAEPDSSELAEARAEYQRVVGKRPYHGWSVDELNERMADAKPSEAPQDDD